MIQKRKRKELYDKFRQGAIPSGADFADFIRSQLNLLDDGIDISDNPDDPICFRAHGEEENILDFSDTDGRKIWRISGRSEDATDQGLNIKADNNSKIYIDRDTGNIGISTDKPEAKVHIKQSSAVDAFRVDDEGNDTTPFIITSDGKVGIGLGVGDEKPIAKLHVSSPFEGDAFRVDDTVQDTTPFIINSDGYVGIGCSDPKSRLVVMGGVAIGENREVETNNLFVKGDLEIVGNMVMSGIEIDGPLKSKDKDLYIQDNVFIVHDPDNQAGSLGNLIVEGNTILGTDINNIVAINGRLESGSNTITGDQQYDLIINEVLVVNRENGKEKVTVNSPFIVNGTTTLGNSISDNIYFNGRVSSNVVIGDLSTNRDVAVNGNIKVTGDVQIKEVNAATVDMISPVGSIIAWMPGYFTNGTNGGYSNVYIALSQNWKFCDGSMLNDSQSPIFNGDGRYLPNLTDDRFLMGSNIVGNSGGNNSITLNVSNLPAHDHGINHNHGVTEFEDRYHYHYRNLMAWDEFVQFVPGGGGAQYWVGFGNVQSYPYTGNNISLHRHQIDNYTGFSQLTGSGIPFNNVPKYLTCRYIMRVK